MKKTFAALSTATLIALTGCTQLSGPFGVSENEVRFENFKRDGNQDIHSFVHLACQNNKLLGWHEPRKFESGQHSLYVRAATNHRNADNSLKQAYLNFEVYLEGGKSYMLNRELDGDNAMKVWIQEVDTGVGVGEVKTVSLDKPFNKNERQHRAQCSAGTV